MEIQKGAAVAATQASALDCTFHCNICLRFVNDPVVTPCGHIYCWPCIYKRMQSGLYRCSACTILISPNSLIPLYGQHGHSIKGASDIPCRPPAPRQIISPQQHNHQSNAFRGYSSSSPPQPATVELLGGVVALGILSPWLLRNYEQAGDINYTSNARVRRRELKVQNFLHQLLSFLFCCAILCLLFFWVTSHSLYFRPRSNCNSSQGLA